MKDFYVNLRQEMIFADTVKAENKEHAVFKAYNKAIEKGVINWNEGLLKVFCEEKGVRNGKEKSRV